jgi:ABC-2 type transport system ATP-binding protein
MKIITGFLSPSAGEVTVGGYRVTDNPMAVKQITGYLAEHNPLYHEMYVHEYLDFMGGIYGLRSSIKKARVREMVNLCGLGLEQNKKIGALSKGYRQRVGLAQALIHDPKILVLDEPTSGLDPNQLVEIRKLIKTVSRDKTVLFSTHILQEVEAICDRVVLINQGRIVADDLLVNLLKSGMGQFIVAFSNKVTTDLLMQIEGVESVKNLEGDRFQINGKQGEDIRGKLVAWSAQNNLGLVELKAVENSLESIFRQLTQVEENAS